MDLGFLVGNLPIILFIIGFASLAPLFRGRLKPISRVLVGVGFLVGILALVVVFLLFSSGQYDPLTLGILAVAGLMLFLRPVRNVRWAALVALVLSLLVSYYAYGAFHLSMTVLVILFVAATLLLYLLFKFTEDLLGALGGILSFPPIAVLIGVVCLAQAVLILMGMSLADYIPPIHL